MSLDRNYLLLEFGPNLVDLSELDLSCHNIINFVNSSLVGSDFGEIFTKHFDFNKLKRFVPTGRSNWRAPITQIDSLTFKGLGNLKIIYLQNNQICKLNGKLFEELCHLERLRLENSQIAEIDCCAFEGLSSLLLLDLDQNKLTHIESNLFKPLVKLKGALFA